MAQSSNTNSSGKPISISTIKTNSTNALLKKTLNNPFSYRVTGLGLDGIIYYETTTNNYGQSILGNININNIAYPSSLGIIQMPKVGEYIDIVEAAEPFAAGNNKANPVKKAYWKSINGSLNIWHQFSAPSGSGPLDNKSLDPTVPNQPLNNNIININLKNMNNSLMGF